jgi:hypothetical protein
MPILAIEESEGIVGTTLYNMLYKCLLEWNSCSNLLSITGTYKNLAVNKVPPNDTFVL